MSHPDVPSTSATPSDDGEGPVAPTAPSAERPRRGRLHPDELVAVLDDLATELVLYVTPRGEIETSNRTMNLGYDREARAGTHIGEHLHPDDLLTLFDVIERARETAGFSDRILVRAKHADGTWHLFDCTVLDARAAHPELEGAVIRARDVTALPPEAGDLDVTPPTDLDAGSRFLSLAEAVPSGILSADARGFVVFSNQASTVLFDLAPEHLHGSGWLRAVHAEDREDVRSVAADVVSTGQAGDVTFRLATGLFVRWAHARFVPLGEGRSTGWIATVDDVTERRRAESHLSHLATHDSLTKLPNRALLEDRLRQACQRIRREQEPVTVLFCDLDGFKAVNDELGHAAGDRVLVEVARRLRHAVRDADTVARLGGDEFVVVCEGLDEIEAADVQGRMEVSLEAPIITGGTPVVVGVSIGSVVCDDPDIDVAELLNRADQAMYRVKHEHHARH